MALGKKRGLSQKDLKLVSDLEAAMQAEKHRGLLTAVWVMLLFIVAFVVWAYNSTLEEVTRGQGSIIPSSRQQIIQSLDAGILKSLHVKEGDTVEKGDLLVTLDDTRSAAGLRESEAKVINLEAMLARYKAEAYDMPLQFADDIPTELRDREAAAYNARQKALKEAVGGLSQSKRILDEQIRRTAAMVKRGVSSEIELLRMQRESADIGPPFPLSCCLYA